MAVKGGGTLQAQLIEKLQDDPKGLYTKHDAMDLLDVEERPAENALYNAWRTGKIHKHVDPCPETGYQRFALKIPAAKSAVYIKGDRGGSTGKKMKKGKMPSAREIRSMFAQTQNQMAKMEDMMVAVVEEAEELEKMMNKIRNISNL